MVAVGCVVDVAASSTGELVEVMIGAVEAHDVIELPFVFAVSANRLLLDPGSGPIFMTF